MCIYLKRLFTKHNPSVLLICILLLFLPIDVALNFKGFGDTTIINYLIVLIDFVLVIEIISRKQFSINRAIIVVSLFVVYSSFFMIPGITSFYETGRRPFALFNCFILFFLCSISPYTEENRSLFVWSSVFSIFIAGVVFKASINFDSLNNSDRAFLTLGTTIDPNSLTTNFCIALAGLFDIYNINRSKLVKAYLLLSSLLLIGIVFLLASRGAILGLIAICVINFILKNKNNLKLFFLRFVVYLLMVTFLIYIVFSIDFFPSKMLERYELQNMIKSQGSGRIPIFKNSLDTYFFNLSIKEVVFGTGFGTFIDVSPISRASHNIYLNTLIESGFLGLLLFFLFIFYCLKNAYLTEDYFAFSALVGLCVCGLSLEMGVLRVFWITLWLCNLRKTNITPTPYVWMVVVPSNKVSYNC